MSPNDREFVEVVERESSEETLDPVVAIWQGTTQRLIEIIKRQNRALEKCKSQRNYYITKEHTVSSPRERYQIDVCNSELKQILEGKEE